MAQKCSDPCPMEARVDLLEQGQRDITEAVAASTKEILLAVAGLKKELYGNGTRNADGTQAGVIPYLERRITATDHRLDERDQQDLVAAEVDAEVDRELSARKIDRKVEGYRDELTTQEKLTPWARVVGLAIKHWPVWVILGAVFGRDKLFLLANRALDLATTVVSMVAGGGP